MCAREFSGFEAGAMRELDDMPASGSGRGDGGQRRERERVPRQQRLQDVPLLEFQHNRSRHGERSCSHRLPRAEGSFHRVQVAVRFSWGRIRPFQRGISLRVVGCL